MGRAGGLPDDADAVLDGLGSAFGAALRFEHEAYAADVAEEAERTATLRDRLRGLRFGPPVAIRLRDGTELRGRIVAVGIDWVHLLEGDRPGGLGAAARHDLALDAIAAVTMRRGGS